MPTPQTRAATSVNLGKGTSGPTSRSFSHTEVDVQSLKTKEESTAAETSGCSKMPVSNLVLQSRMENTTELELQVVNGFLLCLYVFPLCVRLGAAAVM